MTAGLKKPLLMIALGLAVSWAPSAHGETEPPPAGFRVRYALGAAGLFDSVNVKENGSGNVSGLGLGTELAVSYATSQRYAFGLAAVASTALTFDATFDEPDVRPTNQDAYVAATVAPFVELRPDTLSDSHFQFGLGLAIASGIESVTHKNKAPSLGVGGFAAAGHQWDVSGRWQLGVQIRLHAAYTKDRDPTRGLFSEQAIAAKHRLAAISVETSATFD